MRREHVSWFIVDMHVGTFPRAPRPEQVTRADSLHSSGQWANKTQGLGPLVVHCGTR